MEVSPKRSRPAASAAAPPHERARCRTDSEDCLGSRGLPGPRRRSSRPISRGRQLSAPHGVSGWRPRGGRWRRRGTRRDPGATEDRVPPILRPWYYARSRTTTASTSARTAPLVRQPAPMVIAGTGRALPRPLPRTPRLTGIPRGLGETSHLPFIRPCARHRSPGPRVTRPPASTTRPGSSPLTHRLDPLNYGSATCTLFVSNRVEHRAAASLLSISQSKTCTSIVRLPRLFPLPP